LQHPNIVAIHEVGVHQGQHYFAMDLVEGPSLARIVAAGPLPAKRAARYIQIVAEAIEYAHQRGILHRDLKPSNILLDQSDQPWVTDFGLAKRLEGDSSLTLSGQVLGSPSYMPPEQCNSQRGKVGRRSDVHALGATLYHLITGRAPFMAATVAETLRQVQADEPAAPQLLNPSVPRDLATICLKCLEKEPEKRYPTARALSDELGRFLNNEPIYARPVGSAGKAWRWCRRKPIVASLTAAVALVALAGLAGVMWQGQRASEAAAEAQRQRDVAQGGRYAGQMKLAHAEYQAGRLGGALKLLKDQIPLPGQRDFRGFDWRFLYGLCSSSPGELIATNASGFLSADFSPDGLTLALGAGDGYVELLDAHTRQRIKRWQAHRGATDCLAFYPRNNNWLTTVSGDDGVLKLWDIAREYVLLSTNVSRGMWSDLVFSPGGRFLATRAPDALSVDLWEFHAELAGAIPTLVLRTNLGFLGPATFSPNERTLVVCNDLRRAKPEFTLARFDLATGLLGTNLPQMHIDLISSAKFSPDGKALATGGADERVVVWDVERWIPVSTNQSDFILVSSLVFTPDGRTLFASSWDQNLRSWDLKNSTQTMLLRGHSGSVNRLAVAPDRRAVVSAGGDGTVRLWPLATVELTPVVRPREGCTTLFSSNLRAPLESKQTAIWAVAVAPAQDRAVACDRDHLILCDLLTQAVVTTVLVTNGSGAKGVGTGRLTFSPDGRTLAVATGDGRVAFLDAVTLRRLKETDKLHDSQITHIAFALDGTVLVTGGGFGTGVRLTHVASGTNLWNIPDRRSAFPVGALAVSPDGKLLATGSTNESVLVWDIAARRVVAGSPRTQKVRFLHDVVFAPDGQVLAFADEQGAIFLWDLSGKRAGRKLVGHAGAANTLAFSPDGRTLASGGMDHTIRLWHPQIDQEVAVLTGHQNWIWCLAFADHGNALLSGSRDGTLRLWRALSSEQVGTQSHQ
jgi:WD40 repeat protein